MQKVSVQERDPDTELPLFANDLDREEIQKILERGVNDDEDVMYLVKFKKVWQSVWLKREDLVRDLGASFMDKLDKAFDKNVNPD